MSRFDEDSLIQLRRDLHRHPEPAWCEFYTTQRIVEELEALDVDDIIIGRDAIKVDDRMAVPDEETRKEWRERALAAGADEDRINKMKGGFTGLVATINEGSGPTIALRVDIDGLLREESTGDDHEPAAEGYRSENPGAMHACGHDAHAAIGVGVLDAISRSDFRGTLKVFFQPGEERVAGGKAMAKSGHL
ncbi:MAG: M20/M25/M40 family metallo-hydrolase, partial [Halobacteriaceae archaeon]